ncbi:unnamed protein product, partial [Rhizoctonia solani]
MTSIGTLYTTENQPHVKRIRATAAIAGLMLDTAPDYVHAVTNKTPEYKAKFASGKIPAFESKDGFTLFEGSAIARYLASLAPNSGLLGTSPTDAALVDQWVSYLDSEILGRASTLWRILTGEFPYNKSYEATLREKIQECLAVVNNHLTHNTFFLPTNRISLADVTGAVVMDLLCQYVLGPADRAKYPGLIRLLETVANHPKVKDVFGPLKFVDAPLQYVPPKKEKPTATATPAAPKAPKEKKPEKDDDDDEPLPVVDVAPDWESYEYKQIDLSNPEDKAFFEAALAWDLEIDGKKWADGKNPLTTLCSTTLPQHRNIMASIGTLYTTETQPHVKRIRGTAAVAGLTLDIAPDYVHAVTNKTPEYKAKFASGRIPAFESKDGFTLFEGSAIARYIASLAPNSGLLGTSPTDAALVDQWVSFIDSEILSKGISLFQLLMGQFPYNKTYENFLREKISDSLVVLNTHLTHNTFFLPNNRISLADLTAAAVLNTLFSTFLGPEERAKYPAAIRLLETVANQPKLKDVFGTLTYTDSPLQFVPPKKEKPTATATPAAPKAPKEK